MSFSPKFLSHLELKHTSYGKKVNEKVGCDKTQQIVLVFLAITLLSILQAI